MNGRELSQMVQDGIHPVVFFKKDIADQEGYLENGMRGRIIGSKPGHDGCCVFIVDLGDFDTFNRNFESNKYYDKNQVPCLTAREAGFYKQQEQVWVDVSAEIQSFEVENTERLALYLRFKSDRSGDTYVQWLEDALIAATKAVVA